MPIPSAPRIAGTGFSRTKYSVRSRARVAFSFVPSHVWLIVVEILFVVRRNCSRPVEPISSSRGGNCAGSGSSLVRSFSLGLIIQRRIETGVLIAPLDCTRCLPRWSQGGGGCETRRQCPTQRGNCASRRESATGSGDRLRRYRRSREQRSLCRSYPRLRGILGWFLQRFAQLLGVGSRRRR